MADLEAIAENVIKGQAPKVEALVQEALDEGVSVRDILHEGLIKGMGVVGVLISDLLLAVVDPRIRYE